MYGRGADQRRPGHGDGRGRALSGGEVGSVEAAPGRHLAWTALGQGPPLLLLNGYAATGRDWDPVFLGLLAAHFRVVCPDNVGLGDSTLGAEVALGGVEEMAADAVAVLDALAIPRAAVVGWSMGGFIAQALTAAAPARVASLSLISTDPGGPDCLPADPAVQARLTDSTGTSREQASRLLALLFPPELAASADANFGELVAEARAALPESVLRMQEETMGEWHKRTEPLPAADPTLPTAVVHGALDEVIPPANAELLGSLHPGARVEILPGCAHAAMAQEPESVAAAIFAVARA